jgi:hypothetical protein
MHCHTFYVLSSVCVCVCAGDGDGAPYLTARFCYYDLPGGGLWRNTVYGAKVLSVNRYNSLLKGKILSPLRPAMVTSCSGVLQDGGE